MVFLPCGLVALRSDLLVTLDRLNVDVSPVCPLRAGQRQPTRNKPGTPSFWNPEMSAWAMRQEESFDSQTSASLCPAPLYSAIFAWICWLFSVRCHSSHPFPSVTLCGLSSTLLIFERVFTRSHSDFEWSSHARCCKYNSLCSGEGTSTSENISIVMSAMRCPPSPWSSQPCSVSPVSVWPLMIKDHQRVASLEREALVLSGIQAVQVWE